MLNSIKSFVRSLSGSGTRGGIASPPGRCPPPQPVPVLWLFGKTQSGKTSIVKFLTGAERSRNRQRLPAVHALLPHLRFSDAPQAPLLSFLDTRGLDEPGYDPAEDIAEFRRNRSSRARHRQSDGSRPGERASVTWKRFVGRNRPGRSCWLSLVCTKPIRSSSTRPVTRFSTNSIRPRRPKHCWLDFGAATPFSRAGRRYHADRPDRSRKKASRTQATAARCCGRRS